MQGAEIVNAHKVAVLALAGVVPFDIAIPGAIFEFVRINGVPAYEVMVCGEEALVETRHMAIRPESSLDALDTADTIIIPGVYKPLAECSTRVVSTLRAAANRGARIASICSGAFVLAATGLLDGRRATTHWDAAGDFARHFPKVMLDADVLFVDEGQILTSAGLSAGIDLCLHLVRRDFGQAAAAAAARYAVAPLDRDGGQAQFIRHEPPRSRASLAAVLDWALENIAAPLTVDAFAAHASMSTRTFLRRFREQTGVTPTRWLQLARIRRAQELLEGSGIPIDDVACQVGFESPVTFRAQFRREVGVAPSIYRQRFNAISAPRPGRRAA
jgi:transcriptional regulator GlxA family with amidase domain